MDNKDLVSNICEMISTEKMSSYVLKLPDSIKIPTEFVYHNYSNTTNNHSKRRKKTSESTPAALLKRYRKDNFIKSIDDKIEKARQEDEQRRIEKARKRKQNER